MGRGSGAESGVGIGASFSQVLPDTGAAPEFLEEPQDALRPAVLKLMDGDCHASLRFPVMLPDRTIQPSGRRCWAPAI